MCFNLDLIKTAQIESGEPQALLFGSIKEATLGFLGVAVFFQVTPLPQRKRRSKPWVKERA